eukprot:5307257-Amphidinium_carterae.2
MNHVKCLAEIEGNPVQWSVLVLFQMCKEAKGFLLRTPVSSVSGLLGGQTSLQPGCKRAEGIELTPRGGTEHQTQQWALH